MDEVLRVVRRYMRLEICAVDKVNFHSAPEDHKFNTVDVVMRDRAKKDGKYPVRKQLPVLQNFLGGHCGGYNWNPRKGDLVWVFFYGGRQGIVLANAWSWAEYPSCRPSPYDIADKDGQWMAPYQDPCGDFPRQPYPELKKPYCFRWFHGPVTGSTGPGRDWAWLFDYCHLGDSVPSCKDCKNIDSICHVANHFFKFYSTETESRKAYPGRGIYHAPGGSYWLFDSFNAPDETYISEFYTEGAGFWTIQGAIDEILKGHVRHYPEGDVEIHSATSSQDDTGTRCTVAAPNSSLFNFAWEAIHFVTGAFRRILKDGKIEDSSPTEIKLTAPDIVLDGDVSITGSCTHGSCSCEDEFAKLDGASGGQTLCGGTGAGEDLELQSTSNASKGCIKLNCGSANVDPSLTYGADCPCYIETAGLQLAMGCAVNAPYAYWMQVRQSTNVSWSIHMQPLGGDILVGNASGGSKLGINISPAYNLDVLANMRVSGDTWPGYFLQSNQAGSKLWCLMAGSGNVFIRNSTDETNPFIIFNSGGVLIGPAGGDPGTNNLQIMGKTIIGEDPYNTTNTVAGWGFQRYTDGSLYTAWKTITGGSINLRCGAGAETGYARTFLTIAPSTGACYFLDNVSALSFTDRTPAFTGDALAEIRKIPLSVTDHINHASLPDFVRHRRIDPQTGEEVEERNLGNTISLLTAAVRQLIHHVDGLERELSTEKAKQATEINDSEPPTGNKPQLFLSSGVLKIKLPDGSVKTISTN